VICWEDKTWRSWCCCQEAKDRDDVEFWPTDQEQTEARVGWHTY